MGLTTSSSSSLKAGELRLARLDLLGTVARQQHAELLAGLLELLVAHGDLLAGLVVLLP